MRGYLRAMELYDRNFQQPAVDGSPTRGAEAEELLTIIANGARSPAATFRDALPFLNPKASIDVASIEEQIEFWKALGMSPASVEAGTIIFPDILAAASTE